MDLIYTDSKRVDQGVLTAYSFDLSFGESENDFEITLGSNEPALEFGAFVYIEGTEYGGIVDGIKTSTNANTITYSGRTWHGILNSKVIEPDSGADYFVVSGDANSILASVIEKLGLASLFSAAESSSGIEISQYKFNRYCMGYSGLMAMLSANNAKLKITWEDRAVQLSAVPIVDYTEAPVDGDIATLTVEQHRQKVNHLICLGRGNLAEREVIHLYMDQFGKIGDVQYYTGLDEVTDTYEHSNAESSEDLRKSGIERLTDLRKIDKAEMDIPETEGLTYDIGDLVGATDIKSGVKVAETVKQKIIRINNGTINTEYKTGGQSSTSGGSSSSGGEGGSGGGGGSDFSVLPIATATKLGGIMVGDNLDITEEGTLSIGDSYTEKIVEMVLNEIPAVEPYTGEVEVN